MTPVRVVLLLLALASRAGAENPPESSLGHFLGDLSWPDAEAQLRESPVTVLPFAAGAKEHGRHMPMNADQRVMEHLVELAVARADVVVAPPILYGWFPAFREFPSTGIEDAGVFQDYVYLAARSLVHSGARRIVFLNTGIANATGLPIAIAAREIRARCRVPTLVVNWDDLETDELAGVTEQPWGGHADEGETSINLVLQPELVDLSRASEELGRPPKSYPGYRPGLVSRDPAEPLHAPSGIRGDPTLATPEKGRRILAVMERRWLEALAGFTEEPLPPRQPDCD